MQSSTEHKNKNYCCDVIVIENRNNPIIAGNYLSTKLRKINVKLVQIATDSDNSRVQSSWFWADSPTHFWTLDFKLKLRIVGTQPQAESPELALKAFLLMNVYMYQI